MKKLTILCLLTLTISLNIFSKNSKEINETTTSFIVSETDTQITYVDKFSNNRTITKYPKKVVVCYNSILGLWYFTGGESLTKVKGTTNVPDEALDLIDLGPANTLSLEAIIAQDPDLVILAANYESQVSMAPLLEEMGIEVMIIDTSINSFERFKENTMLFSKINGTEKEYDSKVSPILEEVDNIILKAKNIDKKPKVAAIFSTRKSMSLESDIALTGEIVNLLGGINILKESDLLAEGETRVNFSVEAIITQNPDVILFSTMGSIEGVKKNIEKMISENPVWNEVNAVKNGRVYYLPKQYSVYKPNQLYADAFRHIAKLLYPGIEE